MARPRIGTVPRTVYGPDRDLLTARECAAYLGIGLTLFRRLVESGDFPRPLTIGGRQVQRWGWLDPVAFVHLRSRREP